jgi:hypothetical protein
MNICGYWQIPVATQVPVYPQVRYLQPRITRGNLSVRIQVSFFGLEIPAGQVQVDPQVNSWGALQPTSVLMLRYCVLDWYRDFLPVKELPTSGRSFKAPHQCVTIEAWIRLWVWKYWPIRQRRLVGAEWRGLSGNGRCHGSLEEDSGLRY